MRSKTEREKAERRAHVRKFSREVVKVKKGGLWWESQMLELKCGHTIIGPQNSARTPKSTFCFDCSDPEAARKREEARAAKLAEIYAATGGED